MKRIIGFIFFNIAVLSFNIEFNTYEMEVEHVFKASHGGKDLDTDLGINKYPGGGDETGPALFFINNDLFVFDQAGQYRTILLNKDYSFKEEYKYCTYRSNNYYFNKTLIIFNSTHRINIINDNVISASISLDNFPYLRNSKDIYYQDNTLFIFDKDYKLWAIKNPSLDDAENRKNIIKEEQTIQEIQDGKYKGLTIDYEKRLFLNGELQTVDYKVFYSFYKEKNPQKTKLSNDYYIDGNLVEVSPQSSGSMTFLSKVNNGDTYFKLMHKYITVFNEKGLLKEFFEYDSDLSDTTPAVSPEGDVYFLKYGEDNVTLYKVKRRW